MPVDLELAPKQKRAAGERCCEPVVYPDVARDHALRMAEVAKALGDPIRLQLVDVLRKHCRGCICIGRIRTPPDSARRSSGRLWRSRSQTEARVRRYSLVLRGSVGFHDRWTVTASRYAQAIAVEDRSIFDEPFGTILST